MRVTIIAAAIACAAAAPAIAAAAPDEDCTVHHCAIRLSPRQLLAAAEKLVLAHRFAEARPLVAALAQAPGFAVQSRFLAGLIAYETGDFATALRQYEAILADDPRQTSVRLELAKTMLALHRTASADRQFRIAAQDDDLPPEVLRTIRTVRDTIRNARTWQVDIDIGIAPDTNINNATAADSVVVMLGDTPVPLDLDRRARARSGLGVTGQVSARLRLPVAQAWSLLADLDATGSHYASNDFDDYVVQAATGGEYRLSDRASVSLEGVGALRWFGGTLVSRQVGVKGNAQRSIGTTRRVGVQFDLRRTKAFFDDGYSGWQGGLYGTVEQALGRSLVVSAGPFVRRDWLRGRAYSNTEVGGNIGLGGELPLGLTFGISAGASRARYDAAIPLFDPAPRRDWRLVGRATLGDRKIRVLGLSPQISWSGTRVASSIDYYTTTRSRFEFTLARYF